MGSQHTLTDNDLHKPIRLGISACLLGQEVRFDGGHKRDTFIIYALGKYFEWVPVCPEVEMGLGIPRETLRLEGDIAAPRLITTRSRIEHTTAMIDWSHSRLAELEAQDLGGYLLKSKSPSCGLFRVKVYSEAGPARLEGRGIFAEQLTRRWPLLPVEEEGRLNDPHLRENFIQRLFIYHRWKVFLRQNPTPSGLIDFHARHKYTLLAHNEAVQREMGRLVANAGNTDWLTLIEQYSQMLHRAMQRPALRSRHTNVLHHIMGFLKTYIDADDKAELLSHISAYRQGQVPLIVPITLIKHHLRKYPVPDWLHHQVYLNPYPKELMLQNHI
jgi:uncharacterized protein YbgA (DUF1722 family)/uncharacterized protein YbbK (DUF523 family)